jgi:hypothetical protein
MKKRKTDRLEFGKVVFGGAAGVPAAMIVYSLFAFYLFYFYLGKSGTGCLLLVFNVSAASVGTFLLSRRWTADFSGSFFAGAMYGFGPFMLSLVRFHPSASLLASSMPWLFLPAAFGPASTKRHWHLFRILTSAIPFLAIIIFFQLASHYHFFPVPLGAGVKPVDLTSFIWPLAAAESGGLNPVGLYHFANALLFTGLIMMIKARRYKVMAILAAGIILAFCPPVWQVSPIMWFAIPSVVIAILAGGGLDGLVLAGFSDRKWVLAAAFLSGLFSIAAFWVAMGFAPANPNLPADIKTLFVFSARFHLLTALALAVIFFMLQSRIRLTVVRRLLIAAALILDIFLAARYIVGSAM